MREMIKHYIISELLGFFIVLVAFLIPTNTLAMAEGDYKTFGYTGGIQVYKIEASGFYKLETWGAQGGNQGGYHGGYGGYATGVVMLRKGDTIYIGVGGQGTGASVASQSLTGGYNGGGNVTGVAGINHMTASGGGATHMALRTGLLSSLSSYRSDILIVSGGGGGARNQSNHVAAARWGHGGSGGGAIAGGAESNYGSTSSLTTVTGVSGTQTTGYAFGQGGTGRGNAGGGGGFFGGLSGDAPYTGSGGGGSGYIGNPSLISYKEHTKKMYCYNCQSFTTPDTYTVKTTNISGATATAQYVKTGHGAAKITLVKLADTDARLASVAISGTTFDQTFDSNTYTYDISVASENHEIEVEALPIKNLTTVTGTGKYSLKVGMNTITLTGTAESGDTLIYTINIYRPASSNANLSDIKIDNTSIENFNPTTLDYTIHLPYTSDEVFLETVLGHPGQTISGEGKIKIPSGNSTKKLEVVSEDKKTTITYTIHFEREHSSKLKLLNFKEYDLDTAFNPDTLDYTLNIMDATLSLDVFTECYDEEATVSLKGFGYIKNSMTGTITVTEPNCTQTVYTIHIIKDDAPIVTPYEFPYKGKIQTFIAPMTGYYRLETWGAQGGSISGYYGGYGGYATGTVRLKKDETLYVVVGGRGLGATGPGQGLVGGYNGGGGVTGNIRVNHITASGGGATHIAKTTGLLSALDKKREEILIVSGGGGGARNQANHEAAARWGHGGSGGGAIAGGAQSNNGSVYTLTTITAVSGTQTAGFAFGQGESVVDNGAGGGGYFGGYSGNRHNTSYTGTGGGGSGYIGNDLLFSYRDITKVMYCYNCLSSEPEDTYTENTGNYSVSPLSYYAKSGDGYARITLLEQPSENNFLSYIKTDKGTLSPSFEMGEVNYHVELTSEDDTVTLSAALEDERATMTGIGTFDVPAGTTDFPITVTAEDGSIRIYTVTVSRPASSNAKPYNITISGLVPVLCSINEKYCKLDHEFDPDIHDYTLTVPSRIKNLEFTVNKGHKYQKVTGEGIAILEGGSNEVIIEVTSEDDTNTERYTYHIERDMTGNANIETLEIVDPKTDIHFDPDITDYYFSVPNEYTNVELKVTLEDPEATFKVLDNENFEIGLNTVSIEVTAKNGEVKTYMLNIYREQSGNTFLSELTVSHNNKDYELSPTFNKVISAYIVSVPNEVEEVLLSAKAEHNLTTISGLGKKILKTGTNNYQITATAEDGSTQIYSVSIIRAKDNDATLKSLDILESSLSPEFASNTFEYFIDVNPGVTSLQIKPIPTSPAARYEIIGNSSFVIGENIVKIIVTAEDGTKNIYVIHINRIPNSNTYLKSLTTDQVDMTSIFSKEKEEYQITVENDIDTLKVDAIPEESLSIVTGAISYRLKTGNNKISITVMAEDGSSRTYLIDVFRKLNSNANLISLTTSSNALLTPSFSKDEQDYILEVENTEKTITILGVAEEKTSTVSGNKEYELVTGENTIPITVTAEDGTKKEYRLIVDRKKSSNANLSMLIAHESVLSPKFDKNTTSYVLKVIEEVESLTLDISLEEDTAHYEVIGNENFEIGKYNKVIIRVTAEDGTIKEYELDVLRQAKGTTSNRLEWLQIDHGTLTPIFNADTNYYEVTVPYEIEKVTLTGELEDKNATVTGLTTYPLELGVNVLGVEVTSVEGVSRTYQVVVTRQKNNEARLSSLQVMATTLMPNFNKDIYSYQLSTTATSLFIQATPIDLNATYEIIGNKDFSIGNNEVIVRVTAQDGITKKDYILHVEKEKSSNNNLASLTIEKETYTPEFSKTTTVYYLDVEKETEQLLIEAVAEDKNAKVSGDGEVSLTVGKNYIPITVTSEAGSKKIYTVIVTRKGSSNAYLENLSLSNASLSPEFEKTINTYTAVVPYETSEITITGKAEDKNASVLGLDRYALEVGENKYSVTVTAEDGTTNLYTIIITREEIVSSQLKELKVKNYTLEQTFSKDVYDYNVTIDNEVTFLDFEIVPIDKGATWEIIGNENFAVGMNEVQINVTDRLGKTTSTYVLNVNRQSYANTYLAYIYPSVGTLSPEFHKNTLSYTVTVENEIDALEIDAEAEITTNTVTGIGQHTLVPGENIIPLTVTAPNGVNRTYYVTVIRKLRSNNHLTSLEVKANGEIKPLQPTFTPNTFSYQTSVPVGTSSIQIHATAEEGATITGSGNKSIHVGENEFEIVVEAENKEKRIYKLTILREASNNNSLIDLIPSIGELKPSFSYTRNEYSLLLDSNASLLSFTATAEDRFATVSGLDAQVVPDGESTREIVVTAEDKTTKIYTIHIHKDRTDEARLQSLKLDGYTFNETFDKDQFQYTVTVPNNKTVILSSEVEAVPMDNNATVAKTSSLVLSSTTTNIYTIIVTAPDGFTTQTYTIAIEREKGSNSTLAKLAFDTGKLSPAFSPTNNEYTLFLPRGTTTITREEVEAIPQDIDATVALPEEFHYDSENNTYQITVESPDKTSTTIYTIYLEDQKSSDATLRELTTNEGKFTPNFDPTIENYTVAVRSDLEELTVHALPNDAPYAVVTSGDGKHSLDDETTELNIVVTAEDGTIKIYKLTVIKSISTEKYLQDLYLSGDCTKDTCPLAPTFEKEIFSYDIEISNEVEIINIETIKLHSSQTVKIYDSFTNEEISATNISLKTGLNQFKVEVMNNVGDKTIYELNMNRKQSSNNYLKSLNIIDPEIELDFSKENHEYYVNIPSSYDKVQLEYEPEAETSTVKTRGTTYLNYGNNDVEIIVTAEDLSTRTYIIHVEREKGFNNYLQSLTVSSGTIYPLTPKFNKLTNHYITTVPYNVASVQLDAVAEEVTTTVSGIGEKQLKVGSNTFQITAVAETGEILIYTVSVNREKSTRLHLKQLDINNATRKEDFHKDRYTYTVDASSEVSKLDMTVVPELPDVTVKVVGNNNLKAGENTILIILESADKTTTTTYKLTVTKRKSSDNFLQSLKVEEEELITSSNITENYFEVTVPKEKDQVLLTGVPRDKSASVVSGNGTYSLVFGSQSIILKVVAEDGTTRDYEVVIKREYDLDLLMISTDRGDLSPTFSKDILEYTLEVDREIEDITILAISNNPLTTVTGNGYHMLELGENIIPVQVEAADGSSKTYKLYIKRKLSNNNYIKYFSALGASIKEDFTRERLDYTLEVPNDIKSLDLEIELEEEHATYQVEGNENFSLGDNIVQIKVTAEDNSVRVYNLTVSVQEKEKYSNRLLSLEVEGKTMNPVFDPDTMAYTVQVSYDTTSVKVSGVLESVAATVTGFGTHTLNSGRNEIPVVVTSKDNKVRVYTIIINRLQSSDARLKKVEFEECSFTPLFDKDITSYTIHLDSNITSLTEKVEPFIKGTTYQITGNKNINKETSVVTIVATAEDGITKKTYTFTLKHEKSTNNYLESLTSNIGILQPEFIKTNSGPYELNVDENVQSIILEGKKEASTATVTGLGLHTLKKGQNIIPIVVTSESGTTRTYTVIVNKALNQESKLLSLSVSKGEFTPTFDPTIFQYEVTVENSISEIEVFAEAYSKTAVITGDGLHSLDIGENRIEVIVTAEDGSISTYIILVTREELSSSKLLDIRAKEGRLLPEFSKNVTDYTITVPNEVEALTLEVTKEDPTATYKVKGNENFIVGSNEVKVIVTSSSQEETTYTLHVIRASSANNYLREIKLSNGSLQPEFVKTESYYEVEVASTTTEIMVTGVAEDVTSTVTGNDTYQLISGDNYIYLEVTSATGVSRVYTIKVTRHASSENKLLNLIVTPGEMTPIFDPEHNNYEVEVAEGVQEITIDARASSSATIKGIGTYPIEEGENKYPVIVTAEDGSINTYEIIINKVPSSNTNILNIIPSSGILTPEYTSSIDQYQVEVEEDVAMINFDVLLESTTASVSGDKDNYLNYGSNNIEITVTAEDGTTKVVHIEVIRDKGITEIELEDFLLMEVGDVVELEPILLPEDAISKDLIWSIEDETIATVENGQVTAHRLGDTTLEVCSKKNREVKKIVTISVLNLKITSQIYDVRRDVINLLDQDKIQNIVIGPEEGETLDIFLSKLENKESLIKFYNIEGEAIEDLTAETVTTGITIRLEYQSKIYDQAYIAVRGENTHDGLINVDDFDIMINQVLGKLKYDSNHLLYKTMDTEENDEINVDDIDRLDQYILGKIKTLN